MTTYFLIGTVIAGMFLALYARAVIRLMRLGNPYRFEPVKAVMIASAIVVAWPLLALLEVNGCIKRIAK